MCPANGYKAATSMYQKWLTLVCTFIPTRPAMRDSWLFLRHEDGLDVCSICRKVPP